MAIDTAQKRASALAMDNGRGAPGPIPDAETTALDREHLLDLYTFSLIVPSPPDAMNAAAWWWRQLKEVT